MAHTNSNQSGDQIMRDLLQQAAREKEHEERLATWKEQEIRSADIRKKQLERKQQEVDETQQKIDEFNAQKNDIQKDYEVRSAEAAKQALKEKQEWIDKTDEAIERGRQEAREARQKEYRPPPTPEERELHKRQNADRRSMGLPELPLYPEDPKPKPATPPKPQPQAPRPPSAAPSTGPTAVASPTQTVVKPVEVNFPKPPPPSPTVTRPPVSPMPPAQLPPGAAIIAPVALGLVDFGLRVVTGQPPEVAAFAAGGGTVGAVVGGAIGTALGGPIGTAIGATVGGWVGSAAGGAIGNLLFPPPSYVDPPSSPTLPPITETSPGDQRYGSLYRAYFSRYFIHDTTHDDVLNPNDGYTFIGPLYGYRITKAPGLERNADQLIQLFCHGKNSKDFTEQPRWVTFGNASHLTNIALIKVTNPDGSPIAPPEPDSPLRHQPYPYPVNSSPSPSPSPGSSPSPSPSPSPGSSPSPSPSPSPGSSPSPSPSPSPGSSPSPSPSPSPGSSPSPSPSPSPGSSPSPSPSPSPGSSPSPSPSPSPGSDPGLSATPIPFVPVLPKPNVSPGKPPTPPPTPTSSCSSCQKVILGQTQANGNKLDAINTALNAVALADLKEVLNRLGPPIKNGGISGFLGRLSKWSQLDRMMNVFTWIITLHNAYMLSNSLVDTLFSAIDNLGNAFFKDSEGDSFDTKDLIGGKLDDLAKSIFGVENWKEMKTTWKKWNRIYQAAANIANTVRSMVDSIRSISEFIAENTGKIGNALKKFGVVGEKAFRWMPENVNSRSIWMQRLENLEDAASGIEMVTSEVLSVTENLKELQDQKKEFEKSIEDLEPKERPENKPVKDKTDKSKDVSKGPEITDKDKEPDDDEEK